MTLSVAWRNRNLEVNAHAHTNYFAYESYARSYSTTYAYETNELETQTEAPGFEPSTLSIRLAFDWRANQLSHHGSVPQ